MADTVATQVLADGPRNAVVLLTNVSDATGETAVTKVDVSTLSGAPASVRIDSITYAASGFGVDLFWDATADGLAFHVPAGTEGCVEFGQVGGLQNPKASGFTGDIKLSTVGTNAATNRYSLLLRMTKNY
jgi:hypothetical protein